MAREQFPLIKDSLIMLGSMIAAVLWLSMLIICLMKGGDWHIGAFAVLCAFMVFAAGWCRWQALNRLEQLFPLKSPKMRRRRRSK